MWFLKAAFKAFIKPFEVPQRSVKIKINLIFISIQLSEMHGTGRVKCRIITTNYASKCLKAQKPFEIMLYQYLFCSTFHQAKSYAAKAVNAVNAYNEIYRLINSSLNGAIAVNSSVQEIFSIVRDIKLFELYILIISF